ncbi:hypothetical protein BDN72DRAFT_964576 [Pluteus cervinus]|uniref:Uncharacterized protein n=1 Tax=Pluteus cervinus TaxID=181527 RepID=A0ACD3A9M8_9AGAR|nr:hypothetical protein BDN72DRAFT_964576 [Pluteus cervinus]
MSSSNCESHLLPNELWEDVFLQVNYPNVLRLKQTCRLFNDIITASTKIEYYGELTMDGLIDTDTSDLSIKDRFDLLRERRFTWENLQWKKFPAESFPGLCHLYELAGGVYAALDANNDFTALTLPTKTCEGSRKSYHLDFPARDFVMDPTQDLVVFLGGQVANDPAIHLHVRTCESAGRRPHPHSEQSRLLVHSQGRPDAWMIQIADNHVALAWNDDTETELNIRIWNWKSGTLIHEQILQDSGGRAQSFTFLSPKTFAIGFKRLSGYISIWNLDSGTEVSRLHFPELVEGDRWVHRLSVDTPPFMARPRRNHTLMVSPTHRIHTFLLTYARYASGWPSIRVYVPNGFLLSCAMPRSSERNGSNIDVPWENWGPRNTWIREAGLRDHHDLHYFGHGFRILLPLAEDNRVRILDFNMNQGIAEDLILSDCSAVSFTSPTTISYPRLFKRDVVTYLPYTLRLRAFPGSLPTNTTLLRMDERHIVAIDLQKMFNAQSRVDVHTMAI